MKSVNLKHIATTFAVSVLAAGSAMGAAGDGITINEWEFKPYVSLEVRDDSNVTLTSTDEADDTIFYGRIGTSLDREAANWTIAGGLWAAAGRYDDFDNLDHEDWGEDLAWSMETGGEMTISIDQSYSTIQDINYSSATREDTDRGAGVLGLSKGVTDKTALGIRAGYGSTAYDSATLFDWDETFVALDADYEVTDKSRIYVDARFGEQSGDGNADDGSVVTALIGMKSQGTEKIAYQVGVGSLSTSTDSLSDDISEVGYNAEVNWLATKKITLAVLANNSVSPSTIQANNYELLSVVDARLEYQATESLAFSAIASLQNIELQDAYTGNGVAEMKEEDVTTGILRVDYRAPSKVLALFAELRVMEQDSSIANADYDVDTITVGATLTY